MAKIQERIKTDYKAMEASRGEVQQCSVCHIRYRSHEVQPLCSDCEEQQQQAAQVVVEEAPVVEEPSTEAQETPEMSNPYERLDTIIFILVAFGYTDVLQQVAFYAVQSAIEGLSGRYASYAEITDAMRFL